MDHRGASTSGMNSGQGGASLSSEGTIPLYLPQLEKISEMLEAVLEGRPRQAQYTLEQAWKLKYAAVIEEGSVSFQTFRRTRAYQPRGGIPDAYSSNRKVWFDSTIQEWLFICDDDLEAYLEIHNPTCEIPERIFESVKRRRQA